jgi:hypothetical protein
MRQNPQDWNLKIKQIQSLVTMFTQVIVTFTVLGLSMYIILSNKYEADTVKWAFGTAGSMIGYWFATWKK